MKNVRIGTERSRRLYLICLVMFALASLVLEQYYLAAAEGVICVILMIYAYLVNRKAQK